MANDGLPPDGEVRLGPVPLPAGKRIFAEMKDDPVLWATDDPVPDVSRVWLALHEIRQETGLVPVALHGPGGEGHPWDDEQLDEEFRCPLSEVDRLDAAQVLAKSLADSLGPDDDDPGAAGANRPLLFAIPRHGTRTGWSAEQSRTGGGARAARPSSNRPGPRPPLSGCAGTRIRWHSDSPGRATGTAPWRNSQSSSDRGKHGSARCC
jgi:hypothetical protein